MTKLLQIPRITRRAALAGLVGAAAVPLFARAAPLQKLKVAKRVLEVKGKAATVFGIEGWQALELGYGKRFAVDIENGLDEATLLHWHGLTPPSEMDGVPMLSGPAIAPGDTRSVSFLNLRTGTHWVHSHVGLQEQKLLAAPVVVREDGEKLVDEQEHTVLLHDFTFREPAEILAELKGGGGEHAAHTNMAGMDHSKHGQDAMPAMATMTNDISFDAMLANDRTLDDPEVVSVEPGGRVRLRLINGAAATNFWIDLGQLEGELVAVDGNAITPLKGNRFPLAIAQRADVRIALPSGPGAWPVLFQAEGAALRSGVILKAGKAELVRISDQGDPGPVIDLMFEAKMRSVAVLREEPVTRTEMVMLTGGGADYVWGLNGNSDMHNVLFTVKEGERIDVMFHNMTSMAHPMHLHGHYFKVVAVGGRAVNGAIRDTVLVPVNETVTIRFDADNPGTWAFHCHHLYHMNSGMMGAIAYTGAA
jgi:FtsP/CotA-like multicopper oxidase with cupredoxin domain